MPTSSAAPRLSYVGQPPGTAAITPEQDQQIVAALKQYLGNEQHVTHFDLEHRQVLWHSHLRTQYILQATSEEVSRECNGIICTQQPG
jgi:hypothetical protein